MSVSIQLTKNTMIAIFIYDWNGNGCSGSRELVLNLIKKLINNVDKWSV